VNITPSIVTTSQDNIYQIIRDFYPGEDAKEVLKAIELANPQIVSLTSLVVGSRLHLPDFPVPETESVTDDTVGNLAAVTGKKKDAS